MSDGTIVLNITAESNDSFEPNQSQINTINWISSNAILIKKAIFKAVKIYHDKWKDVLDPQDDFMIDFNSTKTENDLGNILGLSRLFIATTELEGHCIFCMEGGWSGDPEHGLGIVMYKDEVLKLGIQDDVSMWSIPGISFDGDYEKYLVEIQKYYDNRMKLQWTNPNHPTFHPLPKYYDESMQPFGLRKGQQHANENYDFNLVKGGYLKEYISSVDKNLFQPELKHFNTAIQYLRVELGKYLLEVRPDFLSGINNIDRSETTYLDRTVMRYFHPRANFSLDYLKEVDRMVDWLKSLGAKMKNDL